MTALRQVWINDVAKHCDHKKTRDVLNGADEPIAQECATCGVMLWQKGVCTGCKKTGQLTRFVGTKKGWKRYCDGVCETVHRQSEKAAKQERVHAEALRRAIAK